ncbi:PEP-CTERM sorting domain-containing protein [Tundrisphaera lichenicola]|uniref:PEP-CTERM sorting domain-containing protein n=1 Tax=Tundrisphaera lichenicola TaxID=2029860 RepID=UPI003EBF4157
MPSKSFLAPALALVVTTFALPTRASAGFIDPKDANLFVQQEAVAQDLALFSSLVGVDSGRIMNWSGSISDTGWAYNLSSDYLDGHLNLSYNGIFNALTDVISWTGNLSYTGALGDFTIMTNGTYSDATVDGFWDTLAQVGVGLIGVVGVVGTVGIQALSTGGSFGTLGAPAAGVSTAAITGITTITVAVITNMNKKEDGKVDTKLQQQSYNPPFVPPFPLPGPFPPPPTKPIDVVSTGQLAGNYSDPSVSISGTILIRPVPEPGSMVLLGVGMLGLIGGSWYRSTRR